MMLNGDKKKVHINDFLSFFNCKMLDEIISLAENNGIHMMETYQVSFYHDISHFTIFDQVVE